MDALLTYLSILAVTPLFFLYLGKLLEIWRTNHPTIPTVGYSNRLLSYLSGLRLSTHFRDIIQEGHVKHPNALFKIPTITKWEVIANGRELVNDIRKARDDELSLSAAAADNLHLMYSLKLGITEDPYHVKVIQTHLSGNFAAFTPVILDEATHALQELIPSKNGEWVQVPALQSMTQLIARTINRLFVGLPYCRNKEYLTLVTGFSRTLVVTAVFMDLIPTFLHPIVCPWISPYDRLSKKGKRLIGSLIEERLQLFRQHGQGWQDKPNDLLAWLIEIANEEQRNVEGLIMRLLFLNFAGTHTTSMVLTHALFDVAAHPEYIGPLREEAERVIGEEGWSKEAVAGLWKMDSFLRESIRVSGVSGLGTTRKVVHPAGFTFSNGVTLPYGAFVSAPAYSFHRDPEMYEDPERFDGYRFYRMCMEDENEKGRLKYSSSTPSLGYLPFGIGRHACPARAFAMYEVKMMLAYFLLNYDWRLETPGGERPVNRWFGYRTRMEWYRVERLLLSLWLIKKAFAEVEKELDDL
ncbi:hypothetical protein AX16_001202 [Volvariella volvacea WC 439]|nr:hypothetical protein AX16_001202 [Volvariella volvacea WC 439]